MKNQVIRIIFDDATKNYLVKAISKRLIQEFGDIAAIEVYEQEFTDEDNDNGKEQWQKEPE